MKLGLENRVSLVTGAGGGIGSATAKILSEECLKVVLTDKDEQKLKSVSDSLGQNSIFFAADLTKQKDVYALADFCRDQGLEPDILVCAAGITGAKGNPLDIKDEDWLEAWQTDFMSAMRICRTFIPGMAQRKWGRVVTIASENAVQPYWEEAVYNVAKAAVLNFSKGLSREYAKAGVLVNTVSPAFIETPMTDGMMEKRADKMGFTKEQAIESFLNEERPYLALHRRGQPDEVAAAIAFLCSERASFINGANLRVDGGSVATMGI